MTKHAKKSNHLQVVDLPKTTAVQIPLPLLGALGSVEKSFFDLCIRAGQQVLDAMMEQDREDICGPPWKRDPGRKANRAGTTPSEVTLGGRRIPVTRPRVRSQVGQEMALPSFAFAAHRDALDHHTLEAVACGISTRKYGRSLDALPAEVDERSVSKSSVSRRHVVMTTKQMTTWLTKPLGDRHFPIVMIDGIILGHLPEGMHESVKTILKEAWSLGDARVRKLGVRLVVVVASIVASFDQQAAFPKTLSQRLEVCILQGRPHLLDPFLW